MKKLVVLSGAGISAESGIPTFRDSDGIWEKYNVEDVAHISAWKKNKEQILEFHNILRREVLSKRPNEAHNIISDLEDKYDVTVITTNVDDFHERAGSTKVIHLHGDITKSQSSKNPKLIYEQLVDINIGDKAEDGSQLRPNVVWFGEDVPYIYNAVEIIREADIMIIIGTSMQVYPAASLVNFLPHNCKVYIVNPEKYEEQPDGMEHIQLKATSGMEKLKKIL